MGQFVKRLIRSPSWATWGSFSARALPLVVLPGFIFSEFSDNYAALWFILITIQGLQLLLESNVGLTFIRAIGFAVGGAHHVRRQGGSSELGEQKAVPNRVLLASICSAMRSAYLCVALLSLVILGSAAVFSSEAIIAELESPMAGVVPIILFVLSAAFRTYGGLHISFLYGTGHIAALRWWECFFWVLSFIFAMLAVQQGSSLTIIAICYQVPLLVNLMVNSYLSRQYGLFDLYDSAGKNGGRSVLIDLWPSIWRSALGVMLYLGMIQGAGLLYARIGEPQDVAIYLFAMSLMRPMMQFAQVPFFTKLPQLAAMHVSGKKRELISIASRGMQLSHILLALLIILFGLMLPVISDSSEHVTAVPQPLWALIGLASILERYGAMHLQLYSQTNHIIWHWANGGAAVIFSLCVYFLLPLLGSLALPLSIVIASVLFYVPFCRLRSREAFAIGLSFDARTALVPIGCVVAYNFFSFVS